MDCEKTGALIRGIRKEKRMTQRELGELINVSDKTVSKWERGAGSPDISLLRGLSEALGVNIEKLLLGDLEPNGKNGGNMKKIKFYMCKTCGNIITSSGSGSLSCCGRQLLPMEAKASGEGHQLCIEETGDEFYITISHEMTKEHYISLVAYVTYDKLLMCRLYPEQSAELRLPKIRGGRFYFMCNKHGLWINK